MLYAPFLCPDTFRFLSVVRDYSSWTGLRFSLGNHEPDFSIGHLPALTFLAPLYPDFLYMLKSPNHPKPKNYKFYMSYVSTDVYMTPFYVLTVETPAQEIKIFQKKVRFHYTSFNVCLSNFISLICSVQ